jgi:hypothetical protein
MRGLAPNALSYSPILPAVRLINRMFTQIGVPFKMFPMIFFIVSHSESAVWKEWGRLSSSIWAGPSQIAGIASITFGGILRIGMPFMRRRPTISPIPT